MNEMNETPEKTIDDYKDLNKLFEELGFLDKWKRVLNGIQQPKNTGDYKWSKLQLIRLLAPILACIIPVLMMFIIAFLAQINNKDNHFISAVIQEPIELPELDPPPPPEKIEVTEITEIPVDISDPSPIAMPSEVDVSFADMASVQPSPVDSVAMIKSPVTFSGVFSTRTPGTRGRLAREHGGGQHTEDAVLRALRYLAKNQGDDGSWGNKYKVAVTSLALMTYLAHGEVPGMSDEFGNVVEKAVRYIISMQEPSGRFRTRDGHDYTQPIAAYALSEAYGMMYTPAIKESAIKAIRIIIRGQNPSGSFDYNLKHGGSSRDDLSYAAWCIQALKAASMTKIIDDLPAIKDTMDLSINGIRGHFKGTLGGQRSQGFFGYNKGGDRFQGLTGAGVLSLQFLGRGNISEARSGFNGMQNYHFNWDESKDRSPVYYWYYMTQAYFQEGGEGWRNWNNVFSHKLVKEQIVFSKEVSGYKDHNNISRETGYWKQPVSSESTGGEGDLLITLWCTLMLEVYYRHLPTFRPITQEEINKELGCPEDLIITII
jgi:hypothetical protein